MNFFLKLIGYNIREVASVRERQGFAIISAKIALPVSILFAGLNYYAYGYNQLALIELSVSLLFLLPALWLSMHERWILLTETLVMAYGFAITLALAVFGGREGSGVLWVYTFPFLAFLIKGQRIGWLICMAWIAAMTLALKMAPHIPGSHVFSEEYGNQLIAALTFYSVIAAAFNLVRSRFEERLHAKVQENTAKAQEYLDRLQFLALHDQVTGLPNKVKIIGLLSTSINSVNQPDRSIVVVIIRLERMFEISNILGVHGSDDLIKSISASMSEQLGAMGELARTRRDEFVYLYQSGELNITPELIKKHFGKLQLTYLIDGFPIHIEHTIGIAIYPSHSSDAEDLLRKAEQAMLQAKSAKADFSIYDSKLDEVFIQRHLLFGKLKQALSGTGLSLHFQAQIDLRSGKISGAEALARWIDAEGVFISPAEFIPVAENSGLIKPFTSWVIRESFKQLSVWHAAGLEIEISINLSTRNLLDPGIAAELQNLLHEYHIHAASVVLEITESSFTDFPDIAMETIARLSQIGFKLSIDDFGTGYSSLTYLKSLKVNELKIDQSFIRELLSDQRSEAIVISTIQLAHNLGLKVVAEGIENFEAAEYLRQAGCDIAQGYAYSKPLTADQFVNFARSYIARDRK